MLSILLHLADSSACMPLQAYQRSYRPGVRLGEWMLAGQECSKWPCSSSTLLCPAALQPRRMEGKG